MFLQVAALFYIGTTKSHPPIPEQLSAEAKDFLLKCLQKYVTLCYLLSFPLSSLMPIIAALDMDWPDYMLKKICFHCGQCFLELVRGSLFRYNKYHDHF